MAKEILNYDDNYKDRSFEVFTPQECADLFDKPVKSKGIVYYPSKEREEKHMVNIKETCYELYIKDWKESHGITEEVEAKTIRKYCDYIAEEIKNARNGIEFSEIMSYSYRDYIEEFGYSGECYVCFDEFLDNEYVEEPEYIRSLLSENHNLLKLYNEDLIDMCVEED